MDRIRPFFTFQGRANRRRYWATFLGLYLAVFIGVGVASLPVVGLPIFGLLGLAATVAALMLGVRRLLDRGKAGWWLIPMYGPLAFFSVLAAGAEGAGEAEVAAGLSLLGLLFSVWAFVELGCLKGTTGANKFGPDPLKPSPAEVFS